MRLTFAFFAAATLAAPVWADFYVSPDGLTMVEAEMPPLAVSGETTYWVDGERIEAGVVSRAFQIGLNVEVRHETLTPWKEVSEGRYNAWLRKEIGLD